MHEKRYVSPLERKIKIGDTGLEPGRKTPEKTRIPESSGAESGAVGGEIVPIDPDLQRIIEAWPRLTDAARADILAMVNAANRTPAK